MLSITETEKDDVFNMDIVFLGISTEHSELGLKKDDVFNLDIVFLGISTEHSELGLEERG